MTLKGKNEIKVKSTTNGRETENIFSSKKSYELVLKHSQKLKSFSSKEDAEEFFFSLKDNLLKKLENICTDCAFFKMDYTLESIKNIEKWYFELYEKNEFEILGTSREEFEEILGIYWGECAIKYNSSSIWIVEEDWLINGKYSFCINIKGWMHITYKYFNDLYKYPDNKTHKRMYREFKKMVMD